MNLKDAVIERSRDAGAERAVDVGIFLLGGAIGGGIDAAIDLFGFAEPMVVAGLMGTGLLGAKKLLFDTWTQKVAVPSVDEQGAAKNMGEGESGLNAELSALKKLGRNEQARILETAIEQGKASGMDADQIRTLYNRLIVRSGT